VGGVIEKTEVGCVLTVVWSAAPRCLLGSLARDLNYHLHICRNVTNLIQAFKKSTNEPLHLLVAMAGVGAFVASKQSSVSASHFKFTISMAGTARRCSTLARSQWQVVMLGLLQVHRLL